jgi:hypothetical protein
VFCTDADQMEGLERVEMLGDRLREPHIEHQNPRLRGT